MDEHQPAVGVGALILSEDGRKILMSKRINSKVGNDTFGTVGGHVEYGEHPIEALKRECIEELNITIKNIKFVHCMSMVKYGKHYIDLTFSANVDGGVPEIMEPDKRVGLEWYDLEALPGPVFEPVTIGLELYVSQVFYKEVTE
jgi:8-oxo-dGTP diphosphatase